MSASGLARRPVSAEGVSSGSMSLAYLATLLFLLLAAAPARAQVAAQATRRAAPRVITNKELEPLRLRREAQEQEYERTRRERGMPSKQELQQRLEEHDRRLRELARQMEAEMLEAELEALRAELAGVRRQLGELSLQLSQQPATYGPSYALPNYYPYFYGPPVQVINDLSFGHRHRFGHRGFGFNLNFGKGFHHPPRGHSPPVYVSPSRGAGARLPVMRAPGHRR